MDKEKPGDGPGAAVEADPVRQQIYDNQGHNEGIRLVIPENIDNENIPVRLWPWDVFRL